MRTKLNTSNKIESRISIVHQGNYASHLARELIKVGSFLMKFNDESKKTPQAILLSKFLAGEM